MADQTSVVALNGTGDAPAVGRHTRVIPIDDSIDLTAHVDAVLTILAGLDGPVHLLATGPDGMIAVRAAVARPDLIHSLVLVDSAPSSDLGDVTEDLPLVTMPALVIAARPDERTDLSASQTIAGRLPYGVFVVVDGVEAPVHRRRPKSFHAWASSFFAIVEGLRALDDGPAVRPTTNA